MNRGMGKWLNKVLLPRGEKLTLDLEELITRHQQSRQSTSRMQVDKKRSKLCRGDIGFALMKMFAVEHCKR
jgi:hypothetical protein